MPKTEVCEDCGAIVSVGDWPFCRGQRERHVPSRPSSAFFEPMVVYRDKRGRIRVPGRSDGKVPKGWDRVEINTRKQAEGISKEMSDRDRAQWSELRVREQSFFEQNMSKNRAEILKLREGADGFVREFIDHAIRSSEESDRRAARYEPGVYWGVLE